MDRVNTKESALAVAQQVKPLIGSKVGKTFKSIGSKARHKVNKELKRRL